MAGIIVMPDAEHLKLGIKGTVLYAEQVKPEHLDDLRSSEDPRAPGESRARRGGCCMNMLLTARQLERLRELPPDHEVLTARDGSPILIRPDGRLWRVQPNGALVPAPPVERVRPYLHVGE